MNIIRYRTPELAAWSPLDRLSPLRELLDSAYRLAASPGGTGTWSPALDIYQDVEQVTVKVELAGMKKEDIEIALEDGALTVSGKREAGSREGFRNERFSGSFSRTVALPAPVKSDGVQASYEDGILTVVLHKAEEAKPRKIAIS